MFIFAQGKIPQGDWPPNDGHKLVNDIRHRANIRKAMLADLTK